MIKSLRLKGFRRYIDETFALDGGVCFVSGRNNAGKTSLFLAVEYALFGTAGGARTPTVLMRPGAPSMGVELVFVGRDQKSYKLQRVHAKPPRARSKVVGHFTLKELVSTGGELSEIYLLSSDFQDHEEELARKLVEITGISRRVFELAVHVRQGEIAQILDGDSKLDIALGITAAMTSNEEMRALALLDERAAEALPALEASRAHIGEERKSAAQNEKGLVKEIDKQERAIAEQQKLVGNDDDELGALEARVQAIAQPVAALVDARADVVRAESAFVGLASAHGDTDAIAATTATLKEQRVSFAAGDHDEDLRGDLRGRIRRANDELASGAPTCHCCGAPIEREKLEPLVALWQEELASLDTRLAEKQRKLAAIDEELRDLEDARTALTRARALRDQTKRACTDAEAACKKLVDAGDPVAVLAERRRALDDAKVAHAAKNAKAEALLEAAEAALAAAEDRLAEHLERFARLEREEARLSTVVDVLKKRLARAEELRALAGAFKALQEDLRSRAALELAQATLRIHRALSVDDELKEIRIDPARYQLLVTARDHDAEVPATLAQGGGHRLLLGLAFRLALVERLGPFPFVLLDEPTYGLDEKNRAALLERIAGLNLSPQIVLITHQAMGDVAGQHIAIERPAA